MFRLASFANGPCLQMAFTIFYNNPDIELRKDMHVLEAIESRKSIRAFTDQAVSKETVTEILQVAQRSPSGTNTQPWHVHVCAGAVKDAITNDALALAKSGQSATYEEYDYYPGLWEDIHRDRRRGVGWGLYGLLGIKKGEF